MPLDLPARHPDLTTHSPPSSPESPPNDEESRKYIVVPPSSLSKSAVITM